MFANIWLTSALIVTAIFSASALYKSYSDIQEAKQIQEHYELVTDIKTLIAKQYNKNPQDVTRDEIIANLPKDSNWEKILLLDRNDTSTISNKEFINSDGQVVLDEDEKLKLLAIKAKLKDTLNTTSISADSTTKKYTIEVGYNRSIKEKDKVIDESLDKAIYYMIQKSIYETTTVNQNFVDNIVNTFIPLDDIYQDLTDVGTSSYSVDLKKKTYYKALLKVKLEKNENSQEAKLYKLVKDLL